MSEAPETNEITVEKLVHGGEGLARIDGRVVFLPFVLPGEVVEIETEESRRDLLRARPVNVRVPSPERVTPGCEYFGRCGGCQIQHASYAEQLRRKVDILREVMARVGKMQAPEQIDVISGPEWKYRNRVQLHFESGSLGFRAAGSHKLQPVEHCPISSPRINEAIASLNRMVKDERFPGFVKTIEVFTDETGVQLNILEATRRTGRHFFDWAAEEIPGLVPGPLDYAANGFTFRVSGRSFFQVNRFLIGQLVESALDGAEGESALDLYAGAGLFSLPLASRFASVTAVEAGTSAVQDLSFNAERHGLRIPVVRSDAAIWLSTVPAQHDFVLADPPRPGLGKAAVEQLIRMRPRKLHIVACDPAPLARDLQRLTASGFRLDRLTLIDLFPQTAHIETIAYLSS